MLMAIGRPSDRGVFGSALYAGLCLLGLVASSPNAIADSDPVAPAPSAPLTATPGVATMAPIPDASPLATRSQQSAAPAPSKGVVVKDGVVMMAPIPDNGGSADRGTDLARPHDAKDCLATAIYFEARGESKKGQKAVAEVVLTRTTTPGRPKTICGVVYEGAELPTGCQFSFTCDGVADTVSDAAAWTRALHIATIVMRTHDRTNPVAHGATYFHAKYVMPDWASHMVKVAQIGAHIFYRPWR